MNKIIIIPLILVLSSFAGVVLAQNQSEIKMYIEAWDRISFSHIETDWLSKEDAKEILNTKVKSVDLIEVMLGKNLYISDRGFESEIDEIQQWLVSLGFTNITFKLATSRRESPIVRRYSKGKIGNP